MKTKLPDYKTLFFVMLILFVFIADRNPPTKEKIDAANDMAEVIENVSGALSK